MPEQRENEQPGRTLVVDTGILETPEKMSPLGRALLRISKSIQASGAEPRSLEDIHRELAMTDGEA